MTTYHRYAQTGVMGEEMVEQRGFARAWQTGEHGDWQWLIHRVWHRKKARIRASGRWQTARFQENSLPGKAASWNAELCIKRDWSAASCDE
jgi:hypothetical protein